MPGAAGPHAFCGAGTGPKYAKRAFAKTPFFRFAGGKAPFWEIRNYLSEKPFLNLTAASIECSINAALLGSSFKCRQPLKRTNLLRQAEPRAWNSPPWKRRAMSVFRAPFS